MEGKNMRKSQSGFTLIELVIVIVILGLLTAVALPRFTNLQTEARIAKMNAALGSIRAGAMTAHAVQMAQQGAAAASVTLEGVAIPMSIGYPTATTASIGEAAGITSNPDYTVTVSDGNTYTVTPDLSHPNCAITYTVPTAAGLAPTFVKTGLTTLNCQ